MTNIHNFPPPGQPREPRPRKPAHVQMDEATLHWICEWRAGRAIEALEQVKFDKANLCGAFDLDPPAPDRAGIELAGRMEWHLAQAVPNSARAAAQLLDCVMEILLAQEKDPESWMAMGPVFQIVKNVHRALGNMGGDTRLNIFDREMKQCEYIAAKSEE